MIKRYNHGVAKPVWCTEYGYGLFNSGSMANIAKNLVRTSVLMRAQDVERLFWYLFSDYASFKTMGLVQLPNSPHGKHAPNPAGPVFANMAWLLHDARYEVREAVAPFTKCQVHKFSTPSGDSIRVCWSTYPATIIVEARGKLRQCDLMGNETPLETKGGRIEIALDDAPIYLLGAVKSIAEKPTAEIVVADSGEEYSTHQGDNNWYYGYFDGSGGERAYTGADFRRCARSRPSGGLRGEPIQREFIFCRWGARVDIPLLDGKAVWAVRRWVSPIEGLARIDGRLSLNDTRSTGIQYVLLVDGKRLDKRDIVPFADKKPTLLQQVIAVRKGSLVDFCVNPGPDNNLDFDAFSFEVRIFAKPKK